MLPNCTQIHLKTILSVEVPALPDTVIFHQPLAEFGNRSSSLSNAPGCLRLCWAVLQKCRPALPAVGRWGGGRESLMAAGASGTMFPAS